MSNSLQNLTVRNVPKMFCFFFYNTKYFLRIIYLLYNICGHESSRTKAVSIPPRCMPRELTDWALLKPDWALNGIALPISSWGLARLWSIVRNTRDEVLINEVHYDTVFHIPFCRSKSIMKCRCVYKSDLHAFKNFFYKSLTYTLFSKLLTFNTGYENFRDVNAHSDIKTGGSKLSFNSFLENIRTISKKCLTFY